jgi:SET domain-containing protein
MNRECGPQCEHCGAEARINPANKNNDDKFFATGCQNVFLQRGVSRRLVIGESQLVGFGAYAAEPIRKGESFAEYVGEVSSH